MQTYAIDPKLVHTLQKNSRYKAILHPMNGEWITSERTIDALKRRRRITKEVYKKRRLNDATWLSAGTRVIEAWSAAACGPLPSDIREEAQLWVYANPGHQLEYMGRGIFHDRSPNDEAIIYLDIAEGRRHYAFRILNDKSDLRLDVTNAKYQRIGQWLDDPEAKIVLSLGGGGFRLFAAQASVRVLDKLLAGRRSKIHEVWGSSGGAMLGYAFSQGMNLDVLEELAYMLYHGKYADIPGFDLSTARYLLKRAIAPRSLKAPPRPELTAWVEAIDRLCPEDARSPERVPFFAVASNARWRHPVALTEAENIASHTSDLLISCNSREATGASMAVPFLLTPFSTKLAGYENDKWFDGSIVEENPLMLPFIKWMRDLKHAPEKTPKKLKIIMIHLNMRFGESKLRQSSIKEKIPSWAKSLTDLLDLLLDSKTESIVKMLTEIEGVEVLTATLHLGRMNFIARRNIPSMIRTGQIIEGWQITIPRT